jgi:transcriptional regulator with XRE-family HTH domain
MGTRAQEPGDEYTRPLPTAFSVSVGRRLEALRERKGWTQAETAQRLGVSLPTWAKWANGERFPGAAAWERIVRVLGPVRLERPEED